MKLHFSKNWTSKFDKEEDIAEYGVGNSLLKESVLSSVYDTHEFEDWDKYPLREMNKLGWIVATSDDIKNNSKDLISLYFSKIWGSIPENVLCRRTYHKNFKRRIDDYALVSWTARILMRSKKECCTGIYEKDIVNKVFMRDLAKLSVYDDGPLRAKDVLSDHGISLIIEKHLSKTYLDGAAFLDESGSPVIGLTLRHDRIDNFWFTLFHELAHVCLHLITPDESFFDDTEGNNKHEIDKIEAQANTLAREALLPRKIWNRSKAKLLRTDDSVIKLAEDQGIHPAIVAGRIHFESGNYKLLSHIVNINKVRYMFQDVTW